MTKLNPLEEALFQTWARANGIDNHDDPSNYFDHRGVYKQTNGLILPPGLLKSLTMQHNTAMDAAGDGGDTEYPDPYAAQAEIHKANLDHEGKQRSEQIKMQMEERKLAHTSEEKQKDRDHKLQLETMRMQQKAQADEANRQASAQQADADRQLTVQQGDADRQAGVHSQVMGEHFERTRPEVKTNHAEGEMGNQQPASRSMMGQPPAGMEQLGDNGLARQLIMRGMQ